MLLLMVLLTLKVATCNFNNNSSHTKLNALQHFLNVYNVNILFLQEVSIEDFSQIYNYKAYVNVGTDHLETAILTKNSISFERVEMLPNGRGMSGVYHNTYFINVYAPSGTNKRKERNDFYQNELPYLFRTLPSQYILGGDFNCVLNKDDTTGTFQQSSTLQELVKN